MRAARKDGVATGQRLFEAACEVFADKGYLNATVSQHGLTEEEYQAGVNAINGSGFCP